jgi:hypothetical protein
MPTIWGLWIANTTMLRLSKLLRISMDRVLCGNLPKIVDLSIKALSIITPPAYSHKSQQGLQATKQRRCSLIITNLLQVLTPIEPNRVPIPPAPLTLKIYSKPNRHLQPSKKKLRNFHLMNQPPTGLPLQPSSRSPCP